MPHGTPTTVDADGTAPTTRPGGADRLLDVIRAVAIVRVVLWHTWSWWWLTWVPAMPAMFFTTGALLDRSVERRGWARTVAQRARRLFLPYWVYAGACWLVMLADGWRPGPGEAWAWVVPLADPVGSAALPGLWIPLWYLRAYLWFVMAAGLLSWLSRRLGAWSVALAAAVGVGLWWWSETGLDVPLAIGDAAAYTPFVLAGMVYSRGRPAARRPLLLVAALAAAVAAWWSWQRFGPVDGIVNRSYLLTMLVGGAGLAALVACRAAVVSSTARAEGLVRTLTSRALTIYLWQGFGLVAAEHLVHQRLAPGPWRALASVLVVGLVIVAAVQIFGGLEDVAAGRRTPATGSAPSTRSAWRPPWGQWRTMSARGSVRRIALVVPGVALAVVALVLPLPVDAEPEAPLSGAAVVARAGLVQDSLDESTEQLETVTIGNLSPADALAAWLDDHHEVVERVGLTTMEVALTWPDGHTELLSWSTADGIREGDAVPETTLELMPWWSMTKTVTSAWMLRLVEQGVVHLDDPLSNWVPEMPRADEITLEHLARHLSGVPSETDANFFEANPRRDLGRLMRTGTLADDPGASFAYSRNGYFLLGLALERASGTTWRGAVEEMAAGAGVEVHFDEEFEAADEPTDPDEHGYRGGLWSSGALLTSPGAGTALLHWLFTQGLRSESVDAMSSFSADAERWYYGLGLTPLCPCRQDGDRLSADRFGIDSATGTFAVDRPSGAAVMLRPDAWWEDSSPVPEFFDLESMLLDSISVG